ncbi:hypothetical protein cypCar_00035653 [Cyprinus carpio]|nr:hypothetical protein cypCar_00035653 [Cyprinus carpio]
MYRSSWSCLDKIDYHGAANGGVSTTNEMFQTESKRDQSPSQIRPNMSDLRIVLVGKNVSENNRVGNLILNKNVFGKITPQPDVETFMERVERRNITVFNTTQLLNPALKLQTITHYVSKLSPPEPHVIILVLQLSDFSQKNRDMLPSVLNCFGEQAMKRTMILTTDDETRSTEHKIEKAYIIRNIYRIEDGSFSFTKYTTLSNTFKKWMK